MMKPALVAALVLAGWGHSAWAEGNLAAMPTDLPELVLKSDLSISQTEYELETGKSYRIKITSDGEEEFAWMAPELFRNSWVDQVVVNDLEVKAYGIYSLEFDDAGSFVLTFVPIRAGRYDFWVDGYDTRGMKGAFVVN
jgi:uncharacterized cupredoxin-like copper-binding protein